VATRYAQAVELDRQVAYPSARAAHEVVVRVFDVGIDPQRARAEVEHIDLAEGCEVVNRLIDGLHLHRRHRGTRPVEERTDPGVGVVAVEQAEDHLPLRRDPEAPLAEEVGELVARLHDRNTLLTIVVDNQIGWADEAHTARGSPDAPRRRDPAQRGD